MNAPRPERSAPSSVVAPALLHVGRAPVGSVALTTERVRVPWRDGELRRVRRGAYVAVREWEGWTTEERARARIVAVAAAAYDPPLFSHASAALLHGLPVVGPPDGRVHVTSGPAPGGRSGGDVVRHTTVDPPGAVVVDGLRVTSVPRTVVDLARDAGFLAAVAAGDHGLRAAMTTEEELVREVDALARRARGARTARRAIGFLDRLSESPGESVSRVRMHEAGLSAPVLQHVLRDAHGVIGRVDFWWPDVGVVGEFDGRLKYRSDGAPAGMDPAEVVWREKVREDRIRATGARVVRWTWQEAWAGAPMVDRLRAAGVR